MDLKTFFNTTNIKTILKEHIDYFRIRDSKIFYNNGRISWQAPFDADLTEAEIYPNRLVFLKILDNLKKVKSTNFDGKELKVKYDKVNLSIKTITSENYPSIDIDNNSPVDLELDIKGVLSKLKFAYDFMGQDASRLWVNGIWWINDYLFVTNNIILLRIKAPYKIDTNLFFEKALIEEIIRLNEDKITLKIRGDKLQLIYENDFIIQCPKESSLEPPNFEKPLSTVLEKGKGACLDLKPLFDSIKELGLASEYLYIENNKVLINETTFNIAFDLESDINTCLLFSFMELLVATNAKIYFNSLPDLCYIEADDFDGIIMPMVQV